MAWTKESIEAMSFRDLQQACKEKGISGKGKAAELKERLLASGSATSKTPTTTKKASASKNPISTTTTPTTTKGRKSTLKAAATTPLPTIKKGRVTATTVKSKSSKRPAATLALLVPIFITASLIASATMALPHCRNNTVCAKYLNPAESLVKTHYVAVSTKVTMHLSKISSQVSPYLDQLQSTAQSVKTESMTKLEGVVAQIKVMTAAGKGKVEEIVAKIKGMVMGGVGSSAPLCLIDEASLASLLPTSETWSGLSEAIAAATSAGQKAHPEKAVALLLVCGEDEDCDDANTTTSELTVKPECQLTLEAGSLGGERGDLQKTLATFLKKHPSGLVVLHRLDQLAADQLPVLINALSEQGGFEDNGSTVSTAAATIIMTMQMPEEVHSEENEAAFKVKAKAHLVGVMTEKYEGAGQSSDVAGRVAAAFRRRIDFVAPLSS